ncbi:MAG TPA: hypothetical protein VJ835_12385, partial [Fimbriimonadaceae bacterium]|nr:hypothetical protein [Fimbriimonadaceae bacterium]
ETRKLGKQQLVIADADRHTSSFDESIRRQLFEEVCRSETRKLGKQQLVIADADRHTSSFDESIRRQLFADQLLDRVQEMAVAGLFSAQEISVLWDLIQGLPDSISAISLGVEPSTVRSVRRRVRSKLRRCFPDLDVEMTWG